VARPLENEYFTPMDVPASNSSLGAVQGLLSGAALAIRTGWLLCRSWR
jgi:hypothetical protein